MKPNIRQNYIHIKVNDIFDELSDENKRLNNELMFANNCINVLNKFKLFLNEISVKYETIIDSEDKQNFNRLNEEFNSLTKSDEQINRTDNKDFTGLDQTSGEIQKDLSEDVLDDSSVHSLNKNVRRSGRTQPKNYSNGVKPKLKSKPNPKRKDISKDKPKDIEIPEPEEAPNSNLLLRRNNFDPKTKTYICPNPSCDKHWESRKRLQKHFYSVHSQKKKFFVII